MSRRCFCLAKLVVLWCSASAQVQQWSSVVRIEVAVVQPNYLRPWEMSSQAHTGGSGFVVEDNRILTNYHVIENAIDIRLSKTGHFKRWRARVAAVGPDVDLATLEVVEDADTFFSDLVPITWSDGLVPLRSRVTVRGYPLGGTGLSVTEGVVSRIESKNYRLGQTASMLPGTLLVIQIDAAINGGNSGGPAFDASDCVVGVAFQGIDNAQNIGYLIPASLARTFLESTSKGETKFRLVDVPFRAQRLENSGLRRYLQVPNGTSGAVVVAVSPLSVLASMNEDAANESTLLVDDVITAIDGQAVGDDLSIALRPGERVQVDCLITHKVAGTTELQLLRGGQPLTLRAKLSPLPPLMPRWHDFDCSPEWVVIGGLVFVPLTAALIDDASRSSSESGLAASAYNTYTRVYGQHGFRTESDREIVLLINVLSGGDVNRGYESYSYSWKELLTFNGERVRSLAGLYATWQRAESADFFEFGFGPAETAWHRKIVLDGALVRQTEEELLALHGIPARASKGVLSQTDSVALHAAGGALITASRAGEPRKRSSALAQSRLSS